MSDSVCTTGSFEAISSVSTRWGKFNVDFSSSASVSSSSDCDCNHSWATKDASSPSSPKSTGSRELQAFSRDDADTADELEGHESGSASISGIAAQTTSEQFPSNQVMVKNILNRFTKKEFMEFLDSVGLKGTYNGAYLPIGRTRKGKTSNLRYAFVDFKGATEVALCRKLLEGLVVGCPGQQKQIEIAPVTTHHPTRKFQKTPKKSQEDESSKSFAIEGDGDFGLEQPTPYQAVKVGVAVLLSGQAFRPPPGLELPAFSGASLSSFTVGQASALFSSPPGDFETFDSYSSPIGMTQACDLDGATFRHLPGLPFSSSSSYPVKASRNTFSF